MVCKNCGADLKPGIKYCLECGSYIEDDEDELLDEDSSFRPSAPVRTRRKRKKLNLSMTDYLIYGGLLLVLVVSIIVIIVTLAKNNSQTTTPLPTASTTPQADEKVTIENYSVIVPGKLQHTIQAPFLYASDDTNYSFSFQIKEDDFDNYMNNQGILKEQLLNSKYDVLSISDKTVNSRVFLIYEIRVDGIKKVLYLTKINSKYTTFGTIDIINNGNWEEALSQIDVICNSVNFQFE